MYKICVPDGHLLAVVEERDGGDVILGKFEDSFDGYRSARAFLARVAFEAFWKKMPTSVDVIAECVDRILSE